MGSRTVGAAIVGWLLLSQACMAQLVNENLLTNLPDGYKIGYQNRNDKELISEMVPHASASAGPCAGFVWEPYQGDREEDPGACCFQAGMPPSFCCRVVCGQASTGVVP